MAGVREAIEVRGASTIFLSGYSLDLNPIEQVLVKLKQLVRSAEPATGPTLWQAIGDCLHRASASECWNDPRNAGTASQREMALEPPSISGATVG